MANKKITSFFQSPAFLTVLALALIIFMIIYSSNKHNSSKVFSSPTDSIIVVKPDNKTTKKSEKL